MSVLDPIGRWRGNWAEIATAVGFVRKGGTDEEGAFVGHQKRACMIVHALLTGQASDFRVAEQRYAPIIVVSACSLDFIIVIDDTFILEVFTLEVTNRGHLKVRKGISKTFQNRFENSGVMLDSKTCISRYVHMQELVRHNQLRIAWARRERGAGQARSGGSFPLRHAEIEQPLCSPISL